MAIDPRAKAEMLIRKPVSEVFDAFVDPAITSKFWFTGGSGRLEPGATVNWEWAMYGFSIPVEVKTLEQNRRIVIEWPGGSGPTTVEWLFTDRGDGTTYVRIVNRGFAGDDEARVNDALASTEGFAFVLAGLKAYLEHGIRLDLVQDKFPDGIPAG